MWIAVIYGAFQFSACQRGDIFKAQEPLFVKDVTPLGIAIDGDHLWISDGDHNKVVKINQQGEILETIEDIERPMHIDMSTSKLYVPSYGLDAILVIASDGTLDTLGAELQLEAPAGISVSGDRMAIADFYNHRILYYNGKDWDSFGDQKSKEVGSFDYPTDVQIFEDKIYVADAYNNRGQIIDTAGKSILVFGEELEMNAATGIFVTEEVIALTDFENDRVVIFDHQGKVLQIISESLHKPTDVLIVNGIMYVTNYKGGYISRFAME